MRYGDTMGRDGESLALKLWRGSAVAAPTVPKYRQLVYYETPDQYGNHFFQPLSHSCSIVIMLNHGRSWYLATWYCNWNSSPLLANLVTGLPSDGDNGLMIESMASRMLERKCLGMIMQTPLQDSHAIGLAIGC